MIRIAFITIVAATLATAAAAQERAVDGVLGGVAGALVGGPIGLVAGGLVGVTAGPAISSAWGLNGGGHRRHHRRRQSR